MSEFNRHMAIVQMPSKAAFLNGYAAFSRAFSFYDEVESMALV